VTEEVTHEKTMSKMQKHRRLHGGVMRELPNGVF
jgi:hypothetical protein